MSISSREEVATRAIDGPRVIVADPIMVQLYELVERLAPARLPVLVTGETGSGKELVALGLHARSPRARERMVSVNCAGLHELLVESELFGHERGAFSGAIATKVGLIEAADGSTLFLDEVGELSLSNQAKLLRVVESQRFMRLGDVQERQVDVRIVAATHRNLLAEVTAGRFREDLFYRLSGAKVHVPPLRQRPNELPLLATTFVDEECELGAREKISITTAAMETLLAHTWPGNVRELRNMMQYFAATIPLGQELLAEHVTGYLRPVESMPAPANARRAMGPFRRLADEVRALEISRIREAILATDGNQTRAAGLLGVPATTFYLKARRYGITEEWRRRRADGETQRPEPEPASEQTTMRSTTSTTME
jgi:transcriptional regulator with GAF, ATPase, and Fis domain